MNFYYNEQRALALRWHDHKCVVCRLPIGAAFDAHHLFITKNALRNKHRRSELDNAINLVPTHHGKCHEQGLHGGGKRAACFIQYEILGGGDVWAGYEIAYEWCKTVLKKTEPDIPTPEEELYDL